MTSTERHLSLWKHALTAVPDDVWDRTGLETLVLADNGLTEVSERVVRAGQPITIRGATASVALTTPAGRTEEVAASDGTASFADTMMVGTYAIKDQAPFAATLLSESETDTTPRDSIKTREGEVGGRADSFQSERETWRWIALAALMILAVEWWIYHRRITL